MTVGLLTVVSGVIGDEEPGAEAGPDDPPQAARLTLSTNADIGGATARSDTIPGWPRVAPFWRLETIIERPCRSTEFLSNGQRGKVLMPGQNATDPRCRCKHAGRHGWRYARAPPVGMRNIAYAYCATSDLK